MKFITVEQLSAPKEMYNYSSTFKGLVWYLMAKVVFLVRFLPVLTIKTFLYQKVKAILKSFNFEVQVCFLCLNRVKLKQ